MGRAKFTVILSKEAEAFLQTLLIATHGFVKKTAKTPLKEIAKAERIRTTYFKLKTN